MTERRHLSPFDQAHIGSPLGPASESAPGKFRPPAELADNRLQHQFDSMPQAGIRTDATEENHLAAGSYHSSTLVER